MLSALGVILRCSARCYRRRVILVAVTLGWEGFEQLREQVALPIYAIGGMCADQVRKHGVMVRKGLLPCVVCGRGERSNTGVATVAVCGAVVGVLWGLQ